MSDGVDTSLFEEFLAQNRIDMRGMNSAAKESPNTSKYTDEELSGMAILNAVSYHCST